jgi:RNA polymerase sigma factor (sigma-70 family)
MKISDPGKEAVEAATQGDLVALDKVLTTLQPGVYNLAVRMLGNRDDAADATQEILLRVITHLGSFRSESSFTTWVFQVARNHLLNAITKAKEFPEVSLDSMSERLQAGLDYSASLGDPLGTQANLTPEDKVAARQVALGCTQNMLMTLDRDHRLAYLLDVAFGLSSKEAAEVLEVSADAYRQRLSRARKKLDEFAGATCGLTSIHAACQCDKQVLALQYARANGRASPPGVIAIHRAEMQETERQFGAMVRLGDAAALFRAHPEYQAPDAMRAAIRSVLKMEGFWDDARPTH